MSPVSALSVTSPNMALDRRLSGLSVWPLSGGPRSRTGRLGQTELVEQLDLTGRATPISSAVGVPVIDTAVLLVTDLERTILALAS